VGVEEPLVELAVLAVRVALNLAEFGVAAGPMARSHRLWREHLVALAEETDGVTRRWVREHRPGSQDGLPWCEALALRAPQRAMARVADVRTDRTLRAEALVVTRSAWMRRAASQLVILSDPAADRSPEREQRLRGVMVDVALRRLDGAQLAARPWRFDHRGAWERNEQLVLLASRAFLDSPSAGWDRREPRTLPLLAAGISRAWLAIAVIDAQLGDRAIGADR